MALELSKSTWLVALHSPAVDKISLHCLQGGDTEGLMALIEYGREQARAALTRPVRVMSCYDGFWLHRFLCDRGIDKAVRGPDYPRRYGCIKACLSAAWCERS
ncbi:hypothetical protein NKH84_31080 [Mesorhizobium sp. M0902]|uniref:hypothetical protein n=1 Tax=Mesorhizobium sp. M0902 TaxID=2957021 RepID=UPI003336193E